MSNSEHENDVRSTAEVQQREQNVLPNGGEIHFTDERDVKRANRIEFLPGGHVKAVYKKSYQLEVYPPHAIEGVYTYTKHLEDEEWW